MQTFLKDRPAVVANEIEIDLISDIGTEEEYVREEETALGKARQEHTKAYGALGGLRRAYNEEDERQARDDCFDAPRIYDLKARCEFQEKRVAVLKRNVERAQERLHERKSEYRLALEHRYRHRVEQAVRELHETLLQAKKRSQYLMDLHSAANLALGAGQRIIPGAMQFPHVLPTRDLGPENGPVERWRRYVQRRLLGQE